MRAVAQEDAAALRRQAEMLRAEAAELRDATEKEREHQRRMQFKAFDYDGSGAVDWQELQLGLKEYWGVDLEESTVKRLISAHDDTNQGVLQFEDFCLRRMERTLREFEREDREKQAAASERERQLQEKEQARAERDAMLSEYLDTLPESNTDTGPLTRLASALCYVLPAVDSLRYALQSGGLVPQLAQFLVEIRDPVRAVDEATFGFAPLLLFITFQGLSNNTDLPKLLRFNLRQSVVLAVFLFFPAVLGFVGTLVSRFAFSVTDQWGDWFPGETPASISEPASLGVFLFVIAAVLYSVTMSLLGEYPRKIPYISAEAERTMAQTRDADLERRLRKQLAEAERLDAEVAERKQKQGDQDTGR